MKFLFTIAKIIPKLGTDNENEKMLAIRSIEKILLRESLSWTDVGLQLEAFVRETLDFVEDEAIAKPSPEPKAGWEFEDGELVPAQTTSSGSSPGWKTHSTNAPNLNWPPPPPNGPATQPHPAPVRPVPPPRPNGFNWAFNAFHNVWVKSVDSRISGSRQEQMECLNEMLANTDVCSGPQAKTIRTSLLATKIAISAGMSLSRKQLDFWREKSKLL